MISAACCRRAPSSPAAIAGVRDRQSGAAGATKVRAMWSRPRADARVRDATQGRLAFEVPVRLADAIALATMAVFASFEAVDVVMPETVATLSACT
jgi:hypothetical protein